MPRHGNQGYRSARVTVPTKGKLKPGLCPCCGKMVDYLYADPMDGGLEKCYPCKKAGRRIS